MADIVATLSEDSEGITASLSDSSNSLTAVMSDAVPVVTSDYEKLTNNPQLDGATIIGDMHEKDPTVPTWAKSTSKPAYTAAETGAVDEDSTITIDDLNTMFGA